MSGRLMKVLAGIAFAATTYTGPVAKRAAAQCEEAKLTAPDTPAGKLFGQWVAISGDYVAAARFYPKGVYIFHREEVQWVLHQRLDEYYGKVAMAGDWLLIAEPLDDETAEDAGAVFVFRLDGTEWVLAQKLTCQDGSAFDEFGSSVAIDADVIVVGARGVDEAAPNAGAVYVFRWNGVTWGQEQKLTGSPAQTSRTVTSFYAASSWFSPSYANGPSKKQ